MRSPHLLLTFLHHECRTLTRLSAPAAATVVAWGVWSDRVQRRSPFVLCAQLLCLAGFAINISPAPIGVRYFGTFLVVAGGYAGYPAMTAWCV